MLLSPSGVFSFVPRVPGLAMGRSAKYKLFDQFGVDIFSTVSLVTDYPRTFHVPKVLP